jgi:HAD superfamily hydrolase (TIGR01549 family)
MEVIMTKAVVFDAYGTIVKIAKRTHPYKQLKSLAGVSGFDINPLTSSITFEECAELLGVHLLSTKLLKDLEKEIKAVKEFPEVMGVLDILRSRGKKLVVCSNLAQPYAQPIIDIFGDKFDHYVWSFEVGYSKPQKEIYEAVEARLGMSGKDIHMVGDTYKADVEGPRELGWTSTLLDRTGKSPYYSISRLNSLFLDIK